MAAEKFRSLCERFKEIAHKHSVKFIVPRAQPIKNDPLAIDQMMQIIAPEHVGDRTLVIPKGIRRASNIVDTNLINKLKG